MKNVFFGKTSFDSRVALINKLRQNMAKFGDDWTNDNAICHIFIVPDRMSVLMEKQIFETLNISSTTNVEVLTLSRLANKIFKDKPVISKTTSCMLLQKLLKENKDKLLCFNKNQDSDLANEIYGTIAQFKSCKVNFDDVEVVANDELLKNKLHDIALLYKAYQTSLQQKNLLDSMDRLNLFCDDNVKKFAKNKIFYVADFDGFTFQGYEIVSILSRVSYEFNIGICMTDKENMHIYNEKFLSHILPILTPYNSFECKENNKNQIKFLQDNLFNFSPSTLKVANSNVQLFEGANFEEELIFCASKIKQLVFMGESLEQINVAIPNLQEKSSEVKNVFDKYGFAYFLDTQEDYKNSVLCRFLKNAVDMLLDNFSILSTLQFLKNPLVDIDKSWIDDYEDYALFYNLTDFYEIKTSNQEKNKFYENFDKVRKLLFEKTSNFKDNIYLAVTFQNYIESFTKLFEDFDIKNRLDKITIDLAKTDIKQAKLFEQYYDKMLELFENISISLGDESCDLNTFFTTLMSGITQVKLSTTPLSINTVFVGDASTSFFERKNNMFILAMDEDDFPKRTSDTGIILDKDIDMLSERYKLEPSIMDINKKERFKAFELILNTNNNLFLSYNYENGFKSKIYEDISKMFVVEKSVKFENLPILTMHTIDFLQKNNCKKVAQSNLTQEIREVFDGQQKANTNLSTLFKALNKDKQFLDNFEFKNKILVKNKFFFKNKTVSVSQIESFMTCPFLHFVRYALKLRDKQQGDFDALNVGLIMHDLAYKLLSNNSLPIEENALKDIASKIFEEILEQDKYKALTKNSRNKTLIRNLKKEAIRFALVLNYGAQKSKFVPTYFEQRFDESKKIKSLAFYKDNKKINLVGQVDRIDILKLDENKKYFRIIDYKTGDVDSSLTELFFGKKVQLDAYKKVVEKSLNMPCAGGYYFPIKSTFVDDKKSFYDSYRMRGSTIADDDVIVSSDKDLEQNRISDLIEVKLKGKDGLDYSGHSKLSTKEDFDNFSNYAINLISKAIDDILTGEITPSPLVLGSFDACKYCQYEGVCRFDKNCGNYKRNPKIKVEKENFEG